MHLQLKHMNDLQEEQNSQMFIQNTSLSIHRGEKSVQKSIHIY